MSVSVLSMNVNTSQHYVHCILLLDLSNLTSDFSIFNHTGKY